MYHPAAALRTPALERESFEDIGRVPGVLVSIPVAWHDATPEVASVHVHDGAAGLPCVYVGAVTVIAGWTVSILSGIEVAPVAPTTPTLSATRYSRFTLPWALTVAMPVVAFAFVHVWPLSVEIWRGHTAAG